MNEMVLINDTRKRLDWIDSIKGVFIFLVVFGHLTAGDWLLSLKSIEIVRYLIYSYHMPMFILITGLFSKKEQSIRKIVSAYIIPYIVFDISYLLWCLVLGKEANFLILFPTYVYWYILCIAIQKLMLYRIKNKLYLFLIVIALQIGAIYVSEDVWRFLSIGRVALLFPVFYFGFLFPLKKIQEMRSHKLLAIVLGLLSLGINMWLFRSHIIPISATHNYYSSFIELIGKYMYMFTTICLFFCLNALLPTKKFLSRWGKNSLVVYLLHPYFTDVTGYILKRLSFSIPISAFFCVIASILITTLLSSDLLRTIYNRIMNTINVMLNLER